MGDVVRTCTNCGNAQATGDFCEKCGTRLPAAGGKAAVSQDPTAHASDTQQAAQSQAAPPPYQYAAPSTPSPFAKVLDLSFQGFVTRGSLKVLYVTSMILAGVYFLLSLIFFAIAADRLGAYWCIGIFVSLFVVVPLMVIWTRVMLELTMMLSKLREDPEKTATDRLTETES